MTPPDTLSDEWERQYERDMEETDPTLPTSFQNEDQYEDWLDEHVQEQVEEFLDYFEEDEIDKDVIDEWCWDAPFIDHDEQSLAQLYEDVKQYSDRADLFKYADWFPSGMWVDDPHGCMSDLVINWVGLDVADRMQIEIESRGVST